MVDDGGICCSCRQAIYKFYYEGLIILKILDDHFLMVGMLPSLLSPIIAQSYFVYSNSSVVATSQTSYLVFMVAVAVAVEIVARWEVIQQSNKGYGVHPTCATDQRFIHFFVPTFQPAVSKPW